MFTETIDQRSIYIYIYNDRFTPLTKKPINKITQNMISHDRRHTTPSWAILLADVKIEVFERGVPAVGGEDLHGTDVISRSDPWRARMVQVEVLCCSSRDG